METVLLDEVKEVREKSAGVLVPGSVVEPDVLPERELERELDVVVMEGRVMSDSRATGDSLAEMGEGGICWMVGKLLDTDEEREGATGRMSEPLRELTATGLEAGPEEEALLLARLRLAHGSIDVESSESSSSSCRLGLCGTGCLRRWSSSEGGGVVRPNPPCLNAGMAPAPAGVWALGDEVSDPAEGGVGKGSICALRSTGERMAESSSPSEFTAVNGMPAGTWERCILAASLLDMGRMLDSRMLPAPLRRIKTGFFKRP